MSVAPGQILSHYRLVEKIGEGGMGVVWKALDTKLNRYIAIKILPHEVAADPSRHQRFLQEARTAAAIAHRNVAVIHEIADAGGITFIVMELVEGEPLRSLLQSGRVPLLEALRIAGEIAEGLSMAHQAGVVHHDLKPENVMIGPDRSVKILDFGLAKILAEQNKPSHGRTSRLATISATLTGERKIVGTPAYMSPEQARGGRIDARSDIFSIGILLYEMVTGKLPFRGGTPIETLASILKDQPPLIADLGPGPPPLLVRILRRCLEKEPRRRYPSIPELRAELERLRGLIPFPPTAFPRPPRSRRALDSLAVLPFENLSGDPDAEYLSDGITEGIINCLSYLPGLRVMARATMFRYKGRGVDPLEAGREIDVRAVVAGRVLLKAGNLMIGVELIDVTDGAQLWGERYHRTLADLLAVQREISRDISEKLRVRLSPREKRRLVRGPTENVEAHRAYLLGRYHLNKQTRDGLEKASQHFQRATDIDPQYALAYAGLADYYTTLGMYFDVRPGAAFPRAKGAVTKALDLDDSLAEAHASSGHVLLNYDYDWAGAEREFKRAIEMNPGYASAHHWYGYLLVCIGRYGEALGEIRRAQELDPLSRIIHAVLAGFFLFVRRYGEAEQQAREMIALDPDFASLHFILGQVLQQQDRHTEALDELEMALRLSGRDPDVIAALGLSHAALGDKEKARELLDELNGLAKEKCIPFQVAVLLMGLDEREQAMDWLATAFAERTSYLTRLDFDPVFDRLHSEPRFQALKRRLEFPQRVRHEV